MPPRLFKIVAIAFIVLSVVPCTAPFATCDISQWHTVGSSPQPTITSAKVAADDSTTTVTVAFVLLPALPVEAVRAVRPSGPSPSAQAPRTVLRL